MQKEALERELEFYMRQLACVPADSKNLEARIAEKKYCQLIESTLIKIAEIPAVTKPVSGEQN